MLHILIPEITVMAKEKVTEDELLSSLRKNGVLDPSQVKYAILEENGAISVIPHTQL